MKESGADLLINRRSQSYTGPTLVRCCTRRAVDKLLQVLGKLQPQGEANTTTAVTAFYGCTVCVSESELPLRLGVPLYVAVMLCMPEVSFEVVNCAVPAIRVTVFRAVVPS